MLGGGGGGGMPGEFFEVAHETLTNVYPDMSALQSMMGGAGGGGMPGKSARKTRTGPSANLSPDMSALQSMMQGMGMGGPQAGRGRR